MLYDFDIDYVKGNTIPNVDVLSSVQFNKEKKEKNGNPGWRNIIRVETDILSLQRLASETLHDPILSKIAERIRRNRWSNCSKAERYYKEIRHKLMMENDVICNGDVIVPLEIVSWLLITCLRTTLYDR